ncbi:MAG: FtsB family cell division protein [Puniceicoccaceae bacterium]
MEKVVRWILLGAIAVLLVGFAVIGHRNFKEYGQFREKEIQLRERIEAEKAEYDRQRKYHRRLMNEPEFLEAVVRDRLGYARENEVIFRFDDTPPGR